MDDILRMSMAEAVLQAVRAKQDEGPMTAADMATARLAIEIADRIDTDGLEAGISLYARLWYCLRDLAKRDQEQTTGCPYAPIAAYAMAREAALAGGMVADLEHHLHE